MYLCEGGNLIVRIAAAAALQSWLREGVRQCMIHPKFSQSHMGIYLYLSNVTLRAFKMRTIIVYTFFDKKKIMHAFGAWCWSTLKLRTTTRRPHSLQNCAWCELITPKVYIFRVCTFEIICTYLCASSHLELKFVAWLMVVLYFFKAAICFDFDFSLRQSERCAHAFTFYNLLYFCFSSTS